MTARRIADLVLKEAYRLVKVREGDNVVKLPAIQAILRAQVANAAKGNGPAQRAVIEVVQAIEREIATQAAARERAQGKTSKISDLEVARRIAFLLERGQHELLRQNAGAPMRDEK